jgi:hypothetical protein
MDTSANIITTMGIISDKVYIDYNTNPEETYFQIGKLLKANGTT